MSRGLYTDKQWYYIKAVARTRIKTYFLLTKWIILRDKFCSFDLTATNHLHCICNPLWCIKPATPHLEFHLKEVDEFVGCQIWWADSWIDPGNLRLP